MLRFDFGQPCSRGTNTAIGHNVNCHKAQDLGDLFMGNLGRLSGIFPLPYSPELNPIGRVRRPAPRQQITHNRHLGLKDKLKTALAYQFIEWERPASALRA